MSNQNNSSLSSPENWFNIAVDSSGNVKIMGISSDWDGNTAIVIPDNIAGKSVIAINDEAFKDKTTITTIHIPASVSSIGDKAFSSCIKLTTVTFAENSSLTSFGKEVFSNCSLLNMIKLPSSVISINERAFSNCTALQTFAIPASITSIANEVFYSCTSLTEITVDNANTTYSSDCGVLFNKDKTKLIQYPIGKIDEHYTIPQSVISIGNSAFYNCSTIKNIVLPNNPSFTTIDNYAFSKCTLLNNVIIPSSVTSIGKEAFSFCKSLSSIDIPASVTFIGLGAFYSCIILTKITVDKKNSTYSSDNGILFNKSKTRLIQYPVGKDNQKYTIPSTITSIGDYAFYNASSLKTINLPNNSAFNKIDSYAFASCISLKKISIPDSVISLGDYAFYNCTTLTAINFTDKSKLNTIGNSAFVFCKMIKKISIPDSVSFIGNYAFAYCIALTVLTFADNSVCNAIGDEAFANCTKLTTVNFHGINPPTLGTNVFINNKRTRTFKVKHSVDAYRTILSSYVSNVNKKVISV